MKFFSGFTVESAQILKKGGVGVIPTDTIYGIVGSALSRRAVNRVYRLRHRRPDKPMIILVGSFSDLKIFGIGLNNQTRRILERFWPGKVSILLPCSSKNFFYLHRGKNQLAFRLPASVAYSAEAASAAKAGKATAGKPAFKLRKLLKEVGPLVAPSANFEGKPPAKTIREATNYFGDKVDFYVDNGRLISKPSTLVTLNNGKISILRQGATRMPRRKWRENKYFRDNNHKTEMNGAISHFSVESKMTENI